MRRDEIKIFPGNAETHIRRLESFADPSIASAHEAPPGVSSPRILDYLEPQSANSRWCHIGSTVLYAAASACVLLCMIAAVVMLAMSSWIPSSPGVIVTVLLVPLIWLLFHLANRWLHRS